MSLESILEREITAIGGHTALRVFNIEGVINLAYTSGEERKTLSISPLKLVSFSEELCSWLRASQIHGWFVDNVNDGRDDQGRYKVSYQQLQDLLTLCVKALETRDPTILPPRNGFFFGSQEIDGEYWAAIEKTASVIRGLEDLDFCQYYYSSVY